MRDKDAVIASMLLAETAAAYAEQGKTLYEGLMELYAKYGYYCEKVTSFALEGKDGLEKMKKLMVGLREDAPTAFAGVPIQAVSDYLKGVRVEGNKTETLNFPASDVLFYEMQGGGWVWHSSLRNRAQGQAVCEHGGGQRGRVVEEGAGAIWMRPWKR